MTRELIDFCTKMHETLTVLKLSANFLGDDAMDPIVKCHRLHKLHIYHARNIRDVGLMKISRLKNLMSLALTHTELVTTTAWIELMGKPSLSRLRYLEFWECDTLNDEVLHVMKINCLHLEKLRLMYCPNITERDEANIAQGFRTLKKVTLYPPIMC